MGTVPGPKSGSKTGAAVPWACRFSWLPFCLHVCSSLCLDGQSLLPLLTTLAHALAHLASYYGHFAPQFPVADILNSRFLKRDMIGKSWSSREVHLIQTWCQSHILPRGRLSGRSVCVHGTGCDWPL